MSDQSDQLQTCLTAVEQADSAAGLAAAVAALAALKDERAAEMLIQTLGYNNPGAAVAAVDGLIKLGSPVVPLLLAQLDSDNYGARAWALRALAGIGDPRGLTLLLKTATDDFALSVRRAATRGLGIIQWEALEPKAQQAAQAEVKTALLQVVRDPEWVVRYAGIVAVQGLAMAVDDHSTIAAIEDCLQERIAADEVLAVRARAQWAVQQLAPKSAPEPALDEQTPD
ncbi:HEAT repeat domain-containing protein [Romeria aff. gracilis LEGE 07310]|uniref:HEAT repeat domain-containing protein n=1 Tax=Vasconcelosia minhoensis LEGE 07310 TaxID=915328 RepID=A0A8J7DQD6_9CYAN|nr:HEAT repeat domain-containing protein [Romeria gracilis]MBE9076384.1 HEAT repeat domain-containing protein [Romeria aff. gracilis LEGE 07310]